MLELGPRELLTFAIVLTGIGTTWGILKATIKSLTATLDDTKTSLTEAHTRLDRLEAKQAVGLAAIDVMAKDILSPQILKERSERDGAVEMRLRSLETQVEGVNKMHNGTHPPVRGGHV
jgi:hypothetical protein